jgi:hypothetical protein
VWKCSYLTDGREEHPEKCDQQTTSSNDERRSQAKDAAEQATEQRPQRYDAKDQKTSTRIDATQQVSWRHDLPECDLIDAVEWRSQTGSDVSTDEEKERRSRDSPGVVQQHQ